MDKHLIMTTYDAQKQCSVAVWLPPGNPLFDALLGAFIRMDVERNQMWVQAWDQCR